MRFKVRTRGEPIEWWTKEDSVNTDNECDAYVFNSLSMTDMVNFYNDYDHHEAEIIVMGSVKQEKI